MNRRAHAYVAGAWTLALVVAHLWPVTDGNTLLVAGWMPFELAYRLAWMGAAVALVLYITVWVWPDEVVVPAVVPAGKSAPEGKDA